MPNVTFYIHSRPNNRSYLTHFFVFMSIYGSISDSSTESSGPSWWPDLSGRISVLPGQAKIQHENLSQSLGGSANSKVRWLDVTVKEALENNKINS